MKGDYRTRNTAGAGAWLIEEWAQGDRIVLKRNPTYWRGWEGNKLERVVLRTVPEEAGCGVCRGLPRVRPGGRNATRRGPGAGHSETQP